LTGQEKIEKDRQNRMNETMENFVRALEFMLHKNLRTGGMAQVVECLFSKFKALSLNPSPTKKIVLRNTKLKNTVFGKFLNSELC
jgi:hypothetical protein